VREEAVAVHPVDGDVDEQLWADVRPDAARRLLVAAVRAFAAAGYHGTTTRDITAQAGVSPAALYVHFPTKADLLARISIDGHRATLAEVEAALDGLVGATERVEAFVATFVAWHAQHHVIARVVHHELTALPPAAYTTVADLRRQIDHLLRDAIVTGAAAGTFDVEDARLTSRAILSLGIDVARWYGLGERARPDPVLLGGYYAELAARMLAAPGPGAR
jgi:AcrR family transcriptional regulator